MVDQTPVNERLNQLLIRAYRSLLQYAVECWPWSAQDASAEQEAVADMAGQQQAIVAKIAELLDAREAVVDFGTYPDLSELHYVSLDYLLGKIIADETDLVRLIESAAADFKSDGEANAIVGELLSGERSRLAKLRELAAARPVPA